MQMKKMFERTLLYQKRSGSDSDSPTNHHHIGPRRLYSRLDFALGVDHLGDVPSKPLTAHYVQLHSFASKKRFLMLDLETIWNIFENKDVKCFHMFFF